MDFVRKRTWLQGIALSVLALSLAVSLSVATDWGATIEAADPPGFDADEDVQIEDNGLTVTWVTAAEEDGFVEYALTASDLTNRNNTFNTATDPRAFSSRLNKRTHSVKFSDVSPGASNTVFYQMVSPSGTSDVHQVLLPASGELALPNPESTDGQGWTA